MLCIRPFAKTSENESKVEFKGILKISCRVSNYFYKVLKKIENKVYKMLSEYKLDNLKEKFKAKEICRLWIHMYSNIHF